MAASANSGFLIIGDLSGYTSYVAATELAHSQAVLTELLELIIARFRPLLTVVKLEGDAVFAYAPAQRVPRGESLLEVIESTYAAFRDRVDGIVRHTTCRCRACKAIPTLDLKFITHYGDYMIQRISGTDDLVGTDVTLLHRLTKNHVTAATGWNAYAMFTEACLARIGIPSDGMHEEKETYQHLGDVVTYSLELRARYEDMVAARHVFVTPEEAMASYILELPAPPAVVWEWISDPNRLNQYAKGGFWSAPFRPGGRMGAGAQIHCAHGDSYSINTVVDWRPFDYFTLESDNNGTLPGFLAYDPIITYELEPTSDGLATRLSVRWKSKVKAPRWYVALVYKMILRADRGMKVEMGRLMTEEAAALERTVDVAVTES